MRGWHTAHAPLDGTGKPARKKLTMNTKPNSTRPSQQAHPCCGGHAHPDGASDARHVRPYPLDVCLVSDEPLGAHGPPHAFVHEGREIKLCCAGCLSAFHQDPAKFLEKLDRAAG